ALPVPSESGRARGRGRSPPHRRGDPLMKKGMKIGIGVGAVVAVIAISTIAAQSRSGSGAAVRTEGVERRDLVATVNASGWIRPHRRVEVQADIMGRIIELNVKEGDRVSRGQVLLRIDPAQYEA